MAALSMKRVQQFEVGIAVVGKEKGHVLPKRSRALRLQVPLLATNQVMATREYAAMGPTI